MEPAAPVRVDRPGRHGGEHAWTRETYAALRPHLAERRWLNYLGDDQDDDAIRAAYGPNYDRLRRGQAHATTPRTSSTTTTTSGPERGGEPGPCRVASHERSRIAFRVLEILAVGPAHRQGHHRRAHLREPGGLAAVAQLHPRCAAPAWAPGVGGLHRERALGGPHHQPLARERALDLVGVRGGRRPRNLADERHLRADAQRAVGR